MRVAQGRGVSFHPRDGELLLGAIQWDVNYQIRRLSQSKELAEGGEADGAVLRNVDGVIPAGDWNGAKKVVAGPDAEGKGSPFDPALVFGEQLAGVVNPYLEPDSLL